MKFKPHKGLLKRVKVTRTGQVKHRKPGSRHRKALHSIAQNRQLRRPVIAKAMERRRLQRMLGFRIFRRPALDAAPSGGGTDKAAGEDNRERE